MMSVIDVLCAAVQHERESRYVRYKRDGYADSKLIDSTPAFNVSRLFIQHNITYYLDDIKIAIHSAWSESVSPPCRHSFAPWQPPLPKFLLPKWRIEFRIDGDIFKGYVSRCPPMEEKCGYSDRLETESVYIPLYTGNLVYQ